MIEAADKKNKILAADPRRSLHRTLVQRRHFQGLREAVAQVERARQAEMLHQLSCGVGVGGFDCGSNQPNLEQKQQQQQQRTAAAASMMMGIARPAHFNPALLNNNNKNTHGWPSNQWTASPTVSVVASINNNNDDDDVCDDEVVTFSSDASSSFEEAWLEATTTTSTTTCSVESESDASMVVAAPAPAPAPSFRLPLGTAGTTAASPATSTTTITTFAFNLPCGTAGLFQTQEVNNNNNNNKPIAAPITTSSSSRRGQGREWGCSEKRMDGDESTAPSTSSYFAPAPFSHVAKKCREDLSSGDNNVNEDDVVARVDSASGRIGFASSPFQWQQLFDPSQLQQVLCN